MFDLEPESQVSREHLRALLAGFSPRNPEIPLVQQQKNRKRQPGWDLCFSAPKSVSVLWSQADPETRSKIQQAQERAVRDALGYLEKTALVTRTGRGGQVHQRAEGGFFALFEHGTSRAHDPQLHTHVIAVNLCVGADGETRTIHSRDLYTHKMAAGALYRASLSQRLGEELGLKTYRPTDKVTVLGKTIKVPRAWYEVRGVPQKTCDRFSQRSAMIEELASLYGWSSPEVKAHMAEATREHKGHINREESFEIWAKQGETMGFGPRQAARVMARATPGKKVAPDQFQKASEAVLFRVKERLDHQAAYFSKQDVVRAVAEESQGRGIGAADVMRLSEGLVAELVEIDTGDPLRPLYMTERMHTLEEDLLAEADELRDRHAHTVAGRHVERAIEKVEKELQDVHGKEARLSKEQLQVLHHVVENPSALTLVQGLAGTGKTSVLKAARIAWEAAGYDVVGLAVSGKASLNLEQTTGIKSRSLYQTLKLVDRGLWEEGKDAAWRMSRVAGYNLKTSIKYPRLSPLKKKQINPDGPERLKFTRRTIVVADEASMINSEDWKELQGHVKESGAKLVPVGDRHQVQSIGAGGPFSSLLDKHEHATLTTIQRQKHAWMREAIQSLAEGDVLHALSLYAEHDSFAIEKTKTAAIDALVRDWSMGHTRDLSETIVITSTNEESRAINTKIQTLRGVMGHVGVGGVKNAAGDRLRAHDRVLFTKNDGQMGVCNGDLGTIINIERPRGVMGAAKVHVLLDRHKDIGLFPTRSGPLIPLLKAPHIISVDLKHYKNIELGYALTTHKVQGATVDKAYVLGSDIMQDKEQTYTQLSRVRDDVRMYLTEAEAGEGLTDFVQSVSQSREKQLGVDAKVTQEEQYEQEHREQAERDRTRAADAERQEQERTRGMRI
jgi:conjugative relaxase-like TrwC/TraI family protein